MSLVINKYQYPSFSRESFSEMLRTDRLPAADSWFTKLPSLPTGPIFLRDSGSPKPTAGNEQYFSINSKGLYQVAVQPDGKIRGIFHRTVENAYRDNVWYTQSEIPEDRARMALEEIRSYRTKGS